VSDDHVASPFQPEIAMPARKRELLDTGTDKRYIRRDERGRFTTDQVDAGRSLAADQRKHTTTPAKRGQGDRGDRQR
jgi:hypothetical protein